MPSAGRARNAPKRREAVGTRRRPVPLYADLTSRLSQTQQSLRLTLTRRDSLLELISALHASVEPQGIAQATVDHVASWLPLTCWCIVAPETQGHLGVQADAGLTPDLGPASYGVAEWVMQRGDLFVSGNLAIDERLQVDMPVAALAFPLRGRERIVGVLVGFDRGASVTPPRLAPGLRRAFETLLMPVAAALDTALLLKRTEELSVTDDLTRLYNSRYLNLVLRRESKLALRTGRSLSLLFIDLDGFKSINDSHGHLAGSRALVEAGAVIRGSARETDIVARFGGDEFALILPDTGTAGALAVAERIRDRIAKHGFLAGDGLDIHITASVGVATLPEAAVTADELVEAADAAMYRVKDRGKNGIQAAAARPMSALGREFPKE